MRLCHLFLMLAVLCGLATAADAPIAGPALQADRIESERARVAQDPNLSDADRKALLELYDEAARWLKQAEHFRSRAQSFARARAEAPRETAAIRKGRASEPSVVQLDRKRLARKSLDELVQLVETEKADLLAREAQVAQLEQDPALQNDRAEAARARLVQARQELDALQQQLQSASAPQSAMDRARRLRDRAHLHALQEEVKMLEQELLSLPARQALAEARLAQARQRLQLSEARVEQLEKWVNERRKAEAEKLSRTEERARQALEEGNPLLQAVAEENARLGDRLARLTDRLNRVTTEDNLVRNRTKEIRDTYNATRRKVEVAGLKGALGQVLLEQRQQLPDVRELRRQMNQVRRQITEVSLEQIHQREELHRLQEQGVRVQWPDGLSEKERRRLEPELRRLQQRRLELLQKLVETQEDYVRALAEQDVALQGLVQAVEEFDTYLSEHLLWVRNTRALRLSDLEALPAELEHLFQSDPWLALGRMLGERVGQAPRALLVLLLLVLVTALRGQLKRAILATGERAGRPGQGRFFDTLKALVMTLVLAGWPVLWLLFLWWQLRELADHSLHAHALAQAILWTLAPFYSLRVGRVLAMKGGVLQAHFRWLDENLRKLRRALGHLMWVFIPASMFTVVARHLVPEGLGAVVVKLDFIVLALSLNFFIYRVFHPGSGVVAAYLRQNPQGYAARLRWLWFPVIMGAPLVLLGLSLMGYVYTGATILRYLMNSLWLIAALVVAQQLAEFWLLLTRRRLAYQAALERRRALQTQRASGEEREAEGEEEKVDLVALSHESRRLLNALLFIAGAVGLWFIWSPLFPALSVLDDIPLWHNTVTVEGRSEQVAVTLGDLLSVVAILVVTVVAARNLPSLIEILLLQYLKITPGGRYTIRTLSGYLIAGLGMVALFKSVGGTWAEIQWLVAALGVGIGFGLQEIVANFISGLIILFERPIRVGDYVTVGDTDGTVTRIRIRATTILTRDRKELLVPNKEFITGRLLNWTLSDQTTRLKLLLGIRYGADVELAEKIMLEAARAHPRVLDEPPPWVNFQDFGDNALVLELRCFIDSADYRIQVLSDLRHAIDRGFRAADMEIPFPQRDVHLDTTRPLQVQLEPGA